MRNHGRHSIDHLNPSADRSSTSVAVQFWLGLLAERRTRTDCFDFNNPRLNGQPVTVARLAGPPLQQFGRGFRSETSSALKQLNDQDDNGNHEQEMN